ncbi:MAG: glycosyltransferase family 4 protein [Candidatus Hydrothermarchaeaceae archaeon]
MRKGIFFAHRQSEAQAISNAVKEYGFDIDVRRIEDYLMRCEFLPRTSEIRKAVDGADFVITDDVYTIPFTLKIMGSKIPVVYRARGNYRTEVDLRVKQGIVGGPFRYLSGKATSALFEWFAEPTWVIPVCGHLAENLSHLNADIATVYNGVDLERFNPEMVQESRAIGDIRGRKIGIIFNFNIYGKVAPLKTTLEWFKILLEFEEGVVLLIAGDGAYRKQIEKTARDMELGENVRFLGHIDKIEEFICACDVIWHPSLLDELPTAVLESMAMEKAVISFDTGGIPEIITHREDGFLVERENYDKFREHTIQLFKDEKLRQKIEKNARKKIERKFSWEINGKKFADALGGLQ